MNNFEKTEDFLSSELLLLEPSEKLSPKAVMKKLRFKKYLGFARNVAASFLVIAAAVAVFISQNYGENAVLEDAQMMERGADILQGGGSDETQGELGGYSVDGYLPDEATGGAENGEVMDGIAYLGGSTEGETDSYTTEDSIEELYDLDYKTPCFVENGIFSNGDKTLGIEGFYPLDFLVYSLSDIYLFGQNDGDLAVYKTDDELSYAERVLLIGEAQFVYGGKENGEIYISFTTTDSDFAKNNIEYEGDIAEGEIVVEIMMNPKTFEISVTSLEAVSDMLITVDEDE